MRYLLLVTIRLLHRVKKQHAVFGILQSHTLMTNGSEKSVPPCYPNSNYADSCKNPTTTLATHRCAAACLERVPVKTNGSARRRARSVQTALTTERVALADMNSCRRSARQLSWPTRPVPCSQEVGHIIGTTRDAVRQRRWKLPMNLMRPRSLKQMREPMEHIVRHAGCKQAEPGEEKPHHSKRSGAVNERDHARDDGRRGQHDADLIRR